MQTLKLYFRSTESQSAFKKMLSEQPTAVLLKLDYILESLENTDFIVRSKG